MRYKLDKPLIAFDGELQPSLIIHLAFFFGALAPDAYHATSAKTAHTPGCLLHLYPTISATTANTIHRVVTRRRQGQGEGEETLSLTALWDAATYTGRTVSLLRNVVSLYPAVRAPRRPLCRSRHQATRPVSR